MSTHPRAGRPAPNRLLTPEAVADILATPRYRGSLKDLAAKHGVPYTTVANVRNHPRYSTFHIAGPAEQKTDQQKAQPASEAEGLLKLLP